MDHGIDRYDSTEARRMDAGELARELCRYDVISFDVFGTLILRPFTSPRVLFSILEERLGIYKFSNIRVDAEGEARRRMEEDCGHDQVTLQEIYGLVAKKTNLNAVECAALEYRLELEYCRANPYFTEILRACAERGKTIVICSDMYLSKGQMGRLLEKNGFHALDEVFVSSELKRSKKRGDLFIWLKERYDGKRIVHVGDDYAADVESAEKAGLRAVHYKNTNDIGGKDRVGGMSYLTGRIYSAVVNNRLYCGDRGMSEAYKLGYIYGGIYVLGVAQWVNRFSQLCGADKIFFLSRDGEIYSRVYDKLPGHGAWEYFYWSRFAGMKITAWENFYEFCQRMIWHKARGVYQIKVRHLLDFYGLSHFTGALAGYGLSEEDILSNHTAPRVEALFYNRKGEILDRFREDNEATLRHVAVAVGTAKKVVIVDVGWAGTGPILLKNLIRRYLKLDCEVYGLLAGYRQPIENLAGIYSMDGTVHSYLFSVDSNRDLMESHAGTRMSNLFLELFTQSCSPSFLGYTGQGLKFDREETQNYGTVRRIQQGIEDFAGRYIEAFSKDPFLLNISPYDAYMPIRELKDSIQRVYPILSDLVISRGDFYDAESRSKETWLSFFQYDSEQ